jgi:hypothetical protein
VSMELSTILTSSKFKDWFISMLGFVEVMDLERDLVVVDEEFGSEETEFSGFDRCSR